MHKIIPLLILLLISITGLAQTRTVTGKVVDSVNNTPIELATIAIFKCEGHNFHFNTLYIERQERFIHLS